MAIYHEFNFENIKCQIHAHIYQFQFHKIALYFAGICTMVVEHLINSFLLA